VTGNRSTSVLVIGAGPAGLTAAYRLAQRGMRVTVVDQASSPGGGLASSGLAHSPLLGCHCATWNLLRSLGITRHGPSFQELALEFSLAEGGIVRYPNSRLPRPLHITSSLFRFTGLSWTERWKLLSWLEQIWEGSAQLPADLENHTAQDWLTSLGHSSTTIGRIWNPLAYWLTGNELQMLSADAFVTAVTSCFLSKASDHRLFSPSRLWTDTFVQPIVHALSAAGATWVLNAPAVQFEVGQERVTGLRLQDGTVQQADWYLTALPYHRLTALLPERWLTRYAYFQHLAELTSIPTPLVVARTNQPFVAPRHMLTDRGSGRWITCYQSENDRYLAALVAFSPSDTTTQNESTVTALLHASGVLQPSLHVTGFQQLDLPDEVLALTAGTKIKRPIQTSPIANLLVAGAWTDTGWPSNLESAIVSGERCAGAVAGSQPA